MRVDGLLLNGPNRLLLTYMTVVATTGHYLMGVVGKMLNFLALRFGLCVVVRVCIRAYRRTIPHACHRHTYTHIHTNQTVNSVVADRGPFKRMSGGVGAGAGGSSSVPAMWGFRPALGP